MSTNPLPQPPSAPDRAHSEAPKPIWSTTTTSGLDAVAAANDEAGALGLHAAACRVATGWRLSLEHGIDVVGAFLRPRLITLVILVGVTGAAATLLFA